MPLARSGGGGGGPTNAVLCNDIADRNSKPLVNKQEYLVLDAIADPNVNSHIAARYMYLNNGWVLLSKYSDLSIVYDYNALINKPSSNVSSIDNAVSKVHDHPNKAVIDADQQSFTTTLKTKLDGIETEANKYIHPVNHPATVITEDSTHRFMTDAEKTKLAGIDENANNYSHPVNHSADMITETTTKQFITEAKKTIINNLSEINNKLAYKGTVIEGGEGGTGFINQVSETNLTTGDDGINPPSNLNPKTVVINIPYQTEFRVFQINVLKNDSSSENVISTQIAFDAGDVSKFEADPLLIFDGTVKLKTSETVLQIEQGILSAAISWYKSVFNNVSDIALEKVEVI